MTFRLISATYKDLSDPANRFRRDLYFRINGVAFDLPPLKQRKEDIALLVSVFVQQANLSYNKAVKGVSPQAMKIVRAYHWPGNIRELKWAIHRAVAITPNDVIEQEELSIGADLGRESAHGLTVDTTVPFLDAKENLEKQYIKNAFELTGNNRTAAARLLGISARALHYKIKKYGLV